MYDPNRKVGWSAPSRMSDQDWKVADSRARLMAYEASRPVIIQNMIIVSVIGLFIAWLCS
jgi:hypothetical protein